MGEPVFLTKNGRGRYALIDIVDYEKTQASIRKGASDKSLEDFKDAGEVAVWAMDAVEWLVKTGIISGYDGKLFPADTTTRAEMAQVLYKLLS